MAMVDVATMLSSSAERWPDRRAVGGPRRLTYRQWDARTNQLARALAGGGVRTGDRVAMVMAGGEPLASIHLALQKLGAASVPLSTRLSPAELGWCAADAEPKLVVCDDEHADVTREAAPRALVGAQEVAHQASAESDGAIPNHPSPDDTSVMLYTAGTTGRSKGVPRSHRAEHSAAVAHVIQAQYRFGETTLGVMPMFHTMGLRTLLATIAIGGTWVPQERFDASATIELIAAERITALYLVPTVYWSLLATQATGWADSVTRLAYAGAAMTPALAERLGAECHPEVFVNHVGSTEVYTFTINPDVIAKPGCAGRAGVFARVRLVDPAPDASPDAVVGPGEEGQLVVAMDSPEAFEGYWRRPDADAAAIRSGWYYTRDLAVTDTDGDLWVEGRVDDMIITGGENVFPGELEGALERCPAVAEVVVAGLPDERWGHAVTAFVVAAGDDDAAETARTVALFATSDAGLTSLQRPKKVIVVDRIPKSAVGKILRRALVAGEAQVLAEAEVADVDRVGRLGR